MDYRDEDIVFQTTKNDPVVYLNTGSLKIVLVVESREQNRELLQSLFDHMGTWFDEHAEHLADAPSLEGSSWRLHGEMMEQQRLPKADDIPDTFPEGWE